MFKVKIKSFDDAVQTAIESGKEDDVAILDDESLRRFDSLFGINRNWHGWDSIIDIWGVELEVVDGVEYKYYDDGKFYVPDYCVEYVTED